MACYSAIEEKGVSLSSEDTVEEALGVLKKNKISTASVMDNEGNFVGIFSVSVLLKNLIPVPITTSGGVQIDMKMTTAPGVARRLAGVLPLSVSEVTERDPVKAYPDEPLWEIVGRLAQYGDPLSVIDEDGKFMGFVTYDSLVDELRNSLKA